MEGGGGLASTEQRWRHNGHQTVTWTSSTAQGCIRGVVITGRLTGLLTP